MDAGLRVTYVLGILRLNRSAIEAIAQDAGALLPGLVIIAGATFVGSLHQGIEAAFMSLIVAPVISFIGVGIAHAFSRLFNGKGSFMSLWRPISHASALNALGVFSSIPLVGGLVAIAVAIYGIVVAAVTIETTQVVSRGAAIVIAVAPAILCLLPLIGLLVLMTSGSAVAPFFYTLF